LLSFPVGLEGADVEELRYDADWGGDVNVGSEVGLDKDEDKEVEAFEGGSRGSLGFWRSVM